MDKKTVKQLNWVNKEFYLKTQEYFNRTRQFYWEGWEKLLPYLQGRSLKVLDVGCGNGRFGKFLKERLMKAKIEYVGMDNNEYLLKQAKLNIPDRKLIKQDVLKKWKLGKKKFDVIVIIALLHHIPGFENRVKLLKRAKKYLKKDGLIILALWRFSKSRRLREKIIPWQKFKKIINQDINLKQLESGDYILDWKKGPTAYRYNHVVDKQELKKLLKQTGLKVIESFIADGKDGRGNKYVILKPVT